VNSILDLPLIGSTRRNHALEHATLHVLAERYPNAMLGGHSNPTGFFILGDVTLEAVTEAATEALRRLRSGDRQLAIHPGCGTNMAVSALLGGSFGWFVMRGSRSTFGRIVRLPFAVLFAVLGVAFSRPLGPLLQQRITTDPNVGSLRVAEVRHTLPGRLNVHRVRTVG